MPELAGFDQEKRPLHRVRQFHSRRVPCSRASAAVSESIERSAPRGQDEDWAGGAYVTWREVPPSITAPSGPYARDPMTSASRLSDAATSASAGSSNRRSGSTVVPCASSPIASLRRWFGLDHDRARESVVEAAAAIVDEDQQEAGERQSHEPHERASRAQCFTGCGLDADAQVTK